MLPRSAAVLALVVACAPRAVDPPAPLSIHYDVVVDVGFSETELKQIAYGIDDWTKATDGLTFTIYQAPCSQFRPDGSLCIESRPSIELCTDAHREPDVHFIGCWYPAEKLIAIDKFESDGNLRLVTSHEIGHALGLHHGKAHTVMYYTIDDQVPPTCTDVANFWAQYGVRGNCKS